MFIWALKKNLTVPGAIFYEKQNYLHLWGNYKSLFYTMSLSAGFIDHHKQYQPHIMNFSQIFSSLALPLIQ